MMLLLLMSTSVRWTFFISNEDVTSSITSGIAVAVTATHGTSGKWDLAMFSLEKSSRNALCCLDVPLLTKKLTNKLMV